MLIMEETKNFVIWLDGFLEACGPTPTKEQVEKIKSRLNGIFEHVAEIPASENEKPSLGELGQEHGFNVNPGFTGSLFPYKDEDGGLLRC